MYVCVYIYISTYLHLYTYIYIDVTIGNLHTGPAEVGLPCLVAFPLEICYKAEPFGTLESDSNNQSSLGCAYPVCFFPQSD